MNGREEAMAMVHEHGLLVSSRFVRWANASKSLLVLGGWGRGIN